MIITYKFKNFDPSIQEKEYLEKRIEGLVHLAKRIKDESSSIVFESEKTTAKEHAERFLVITNISIPGKVLSAEARAEKLSEAVDMVEEKLHVQIGKYKDKRDDRKKATASHDISEQILDSEDDE